ncbi:MAG: adenylate kinase family protein [Nitrososphaeria archaeon]
MYKSWYQRIGITGSPATGKKTLAKALSRKTAFRVVNLNYLCISRGAISGRDKYGIIADTAKLRRIVQKEIIEDKFIIVGHLLPYVTSKKDLDIVFILRCNPYVLEERLKERKYAEKKVLMNVGAEVLGTTYIDSIKRYGIDKIHVIDTSTKMLDDVTREALSVLKGRSKYDGLDIDWLELVRKKGDLRRIFPDSYY